MRFQKHPLWIFFILCLFGVSLGYSVHSFFEITHYLSLKQKTPTLSTFPHITSKKGKGYQLEVTYCYEINQKVYEKRQRASNIFFKNREFAKEAYLSIAQKPSWVWYSEKKPEKGDLIKKFPLKNLFSAGLIVSISIYFWALGHYISKKKVG